MGKKKYSDLEPDGWYWIKALNQWVVAQLSSDGTAFYVIDGFYYVDQVQEIGEQVLRKTE